MDADAARPPIRLTWITAAFGCAAAALATGIGADARWLAAIGADIVRARSLPDSVPYAAAPSDWHDAPVLGQLVFHWLQAGFGDKGFVLAQLVAVAIALGATALDLRRARVRDGAGAAVLLAVLLAAPATFLVARAQLYSIALFPVLLLLLREDARGRTRRLWLCAPLLVLWANLHGGVLVGYGALLVYLVVRRRSFEGAALAAAASAALFVTPALADTGAYYAGVLRGAAATSHYGLWAPLSPRDPLDLLYVAFALPLLLVALRNRPALWEVALLLGLGAMSVDSRRNGIWFLLFVATPAARTRLHGAAKAPLLSTRTALVCGAMPLAMIALGLARTPFPAGPTEGLIARAVDVSDGTPILAEPIAAEQLALEGHHIWIGNPLDAFALEDQRLYLEWLEGRPAGDALLRPPVRAVLVRRDTPAQRRLAQLGRYREIARDARAVLYAART